MRFEWKWVVDSYFVWFCLGFTWRFLGFPCSVGRFEDENGHEFPLGSVLFGSYVRDLVSLDDGEL